MRTKRFFIFVFVISFLLATAPGFAIKPPTKALRAGRKAAQIKQKALPTSPISTLPNYTLTLSNQMPYAISTPSLAVDEAFTQLERTSKRKIPT